MACLNFPNAIGALGKLGFIKQTRLQNKCYGEYPYNSELVNLVAISAPSENVNLDRVYVEEEVINGERFTTDMIPTARAISGEIPFNAHPEQLGWFVYGALGSYKQQKEDDGTSFIIGQVSAPLGSIFITYVGTARSALMSKNGNILSCKIGNEGYEEPDTTFGNINLTTYPTLGQLETYINTIPNYRAFVVGNKTAPTNKIRDFSDFYCKNTALQLESINFGFVTVRYVGAQQSCLLSIDKTTKQLKSRVGNLGVEVLDTNFGTGGIIDLTNVSVDTLAELQAVIDSYADYEATLVGDGTLLSRNIIAFNETQIKTTTGKRLYSAEAIRHRIIPVSAGQSTPSFFLIFDRVMDTFGYTGIKFGDISLEMTPRAITTGSLTVVGQDEILKDAAENDLVFPNISLEDTRPYIASKIDVYLNGVKTMKCKNISFKMTNNLDAEMTKLGSELVDEPQPMMGEITLDMEFYMNELTNELRTKYTNGQNMEVLIVGTGFEKADSGQTIDRSFIIRFKECVITQAPANLSTRDTLTMSLSVRAVKPKYYAGYPVNKRYSIIEWDVVTNESDYDL